MNPLQKKVLRDLFYVYKCFVCMCTCAPCVCLAPGSSTRATGALDCRAIGPTKASYDLHWFPLPRGVRQAQVLSRLPPPLDCICCSSGIDFERKRWRVMRNELVCIGRRSAKRRMLKNEAGSQDTRLCSGPLLPSGNGRGLSLPAPS